MPNNGRITLCPYYRDEKNLSISCEDVFRRFRWKKQKTNWMDTYCDAYITSRVEGYKYGMDENLQKQNLYALFSVIVPAGLEVNPILTEQWRQYLQESYRLQQAQQ